MSLKSLFVGDGPAYRLPSGAPAGQQTFIADTDGAVAWGDAATAADITALQEQVALVEAAEALNKSGIEELVAEVAALIVENAGQADKLTTQGLAIDTNRADIDYLLSLIPPPPPPPTGPTWIYFDGVSELNFPSGNGAAGSTIMSFANDFVIGITLNAYESGPTVNDKMSLLASGGTSFTINRGTDPLTAASNCGTYLTVDLGGGGLYSADTRLTANTWVFSQPTGKIMWRYTESTSTLDYYIGAPDGSYVKRATQTVSATLKSNQVVGDNLAISLGWIAQTGGAAFSGTPWRGGLRQLVMSAGVPWIEADVATYMAQDEFGPTLPLWSKITSYCVKSYYIGVLWGASWEAQ